MRDQAEICRTAQELVRQYGVAARQHASLRASELLEAGDLAGAEIWRRVMDAIEDLTERNARNAVSRQRLAAHRPIGRGPYRIATGCRETISILRIDTLHRPVKRRRSARSAISFSNFLTVIVN